MVFLSIGTKHNKYYRTLKSVLLSEPSQVAAAPRPYAVSVPFQGQNRTLVVLAPYGAAEAPAPERIARDTSLEGEAEKSKRVFSPKTSA